MRTPAPFIVGVPRSGTTLLRLMLDAHPQLTIPPETHFVPKLVKMWRREGAGAGKCADWIIGHPRWGDFGLDEDELRARFTAIDPFDLGEALRAFYGMYADRQGKPRWGDKSPNYVLGMRRITRVLPEAHFVHVIRDGRDVAVSMMERSWGPSEVAGAAERWVADIDRAREQTRRPRNPLWWRRIPKYMEVRYEDLVTDPEPYLRRVCEFVDLPWDDAMLAFHEQADERMKEVVRDVTTRRGAEISAAERAAQHELVSRPPTSDRVGRWRTKMEPSDQATFAEHAGGLLEELGYPAGAERVQAP